MVPNTELGTERVGVILRRCTTGIVEGWLARAKQSDLSVVPLSDEQRAVHIPRLVEDLALRLSKSSAAVKDSDAIFSTAAVAHGKLRYLQGYTPGMLVDESRITEVTVFGMLQSKLNSLDFSLLLPDVTAIADEVDGQLTQSMDGYMELKARADARGLARNARACARGGGPRSNTNPNPGDYIHNVVNVFHRSAIAGSGAV